MELPVGHRRHTRRQVFDSLGHQASQGDWARGFGRRAIDDDPWGLDLFDPRRVAFRAPADQAGRVVELRQAIFEVVRPFIITDAAWERLGAALHALYTDEALGSFMAGHGGNLFLVTPTSSSTTSASWPPAAWRSEPGSRRTTPSPPPTTRPAASRSSPTASSPSSTTRGSGP